MITQLPNGKFKITGEFGVKVKSSGKVFNAVNDVTEDELGLFEEINIDPNAEILPQEEPIVVGESAE